MVLDRQVAVTRVMCMFDELSESPQFGSPGSTALGGRIGFRSGNRLRRWPIQDPTDQGRGQ